MIYAFDFWITLTNSEPTRELARKLYFEGHEVHIVSAISPGLPLDNDEVYSSMLAQLNVPYTAIHRTDHVPEQKVAVLRAINADEFWDDDPQYVDAATAAGFRAHLVRKD